MFLCINLMFSFIEVALFTKSDLLFYKNTVNRDESLAIAEILQEIKQAYNLSDLEGILVSQGPGRFTALRVGVSVAQTLAYTQNIPLYPFQSSQYFQSFNIQKEVIFLQQVGLQEVFIKGKRYKFEELENLYPENLSWIGDVRTLHLLPDTWEQEEMPKRDLDFFLKLKSLTKAEKSVSIEYGKEPNIFK